MMFRNLKKTISNRSAQNSTATAGRGLVHRLSIATLVAAAVCVATVGCAEPESKLENVPNIPPGDKAVDGQGKASLVPPAPAGRGK